MTDTQDIRRALENRLNAGSYTGITNSTDIAWENVNYDPTAKSVWLQPRLVIDEQLPSVIGTGLAVRWTGRFLINCYTKENLGTATLDDLADDVLAQFPYGTQLTENSKTVNIRFAQRGSAIHDSPFYFCQVSLTWYAYIS